MTAPLFFWDRPVPEAWRVALRRFAPPRDRAPHLTISWLSGDHETPVQRWLLWQCTPRALLDRGDPQSASPWDFFEAFVLHDWTRNEETRWKTRYYRATGCVPEPLWVLQGSPAGHPFRYQPWEIEVAKELGLPLDPERPGALAYQAFYPDIVLPRLFARSLFTKAHADPMAETARRVEEAARHRRKAQVAREEALYAGLVQHALPEMLASEPGTRRVERETPEANRWERGSLDEDNARFIETGDYRPVAA